MCCRSEEDDGVLRLVVVVDIVWGEEGRLSLPARKRQSCSMHSRENDTEAAARVSVGRSRVKREREERDV